MTLPSRRGEETDKESSDILGWPCLLEALKGPNGFMYTVSRWINQWMAFFICQSYLMIVHCSACTLLRSLKLRLACFCDWRISRFLPYWVLWLALVNQIWRKLSNWPQTSSTCWEVIDVKVNLTDCAISRGPSCRLPVILIPIIFQEGQSERWIFSMAALQGVCTLMQPLPMMWIQPVRFDRLGCRWIVATGLAPLWMTGIMQNHP